MKLHQNKKLYRDAIQFTAKQLNLPPEFVEKDYWVTYALFTIFDEEVGKDTVFKGGTALSKCYRLIDRFSEDIDLVVVRREGETNNRLKTKIKKISKIVDRELPEVKIDGLTHKMGMNRKTAHRYNKIFNGKYGQVRDVIVLESTWLGYYEPCTTKKIISFLGQMMLNNKQSHIAEEYKLLPFEVMTLEPVRTICEKIMSLVRFSYGENPIEDLKKKNRHTYDLHQLLRQKEFSDFFNSSAFDEMLLRVATDDVSSFRNNNQWLAHHPSNAIIFKNTNGVWDGLKAGYRREFGDLVYGDLPKESEILETLIMIGKRLEKIKWTIQIDTEQ